MRAKGKRVDVLGSPEPASSICISFLLSRSQEAASPQDEDASYILLPAVAGERETETERGKESLDV